MKSLRARVIVFALIVITAVVIPLGVLSYRQTVQQFDDLGDARLVQTTRTIDALAESAGLHGTKAGTPAEVVVWHSPFIEHVTDHGHVYEIRLGFQYWNEAARLRLTSDNFRQVALTAARPGFTYLTLPDGRWRVFTLRDSDGDTIRVAEQDAGRSALARDLLWEHLTPMLLALPILALLVGWAVRRALGPLDMLSRALTARRPEETGPVALSDVPRELDPVLKSLNGLVGRVQVALDRERQFAADAAHQLRTPLAAALLHIENALAGESVELRNVALKRAHEGLERLQHLVQQFLELARWESTDRALPREPVDLERCVRTEIEEAAVLAADKDLDVAIVIDAPGISVLGWKAALHAAMRNLIDNAFRYSPRGGQVEVRLSEHEGAALVELSDSGPGIPPAEREVVLERFRQGNRADIHGSGLGLAIVQRVAHLHGARVELQGSRFGSGLCVQVKFPAQLLIAVLSFCWLGLTGCVHYVPKPLAPEQTALTLEKRTLSDAGLRSFIERNTGHALPEWPLRSWNIDQLTLVAFYYSPELDLARARWSEANAAVVTARARPNPTLSLSPEYSTPPAPGAGAWTPGVAFDVPIETASKRGHRIAQAQYLSEAARWSIVTSAWGVRSALVTALLDYSAARRREEILKRQLELQEKIVRLQEGELAAGAVAGSEVTAARIQAAKTRLDLDTTRAQVVDARARSAEALGVPSRALDQVELEFDFGPTDSSMLTTEQARGRALTGRSDVLGALAEYEATQAALQGEIAKQYPDIHLGPGYKWDQGENKWSIGLTLELPVFNRNRGPIDEATARRQQAAGNFVALQAKVIHEVDAASAALILAEESAGNAQSLLFTQRQSLEAVERQIAAGAAGALEQAAAQVDVANAESLAFEASVRRQQAVRALEIAVQRPPLGSEALARAAMSQIESTERSPR